MERDKLNFNCTHSHIIEPMSQFWGQAVLMIIYFLTGLCTIIDFDLLKAGDTSEIDHLWEVATSVKFLL
jgi:hypothetical protein